MRVKGRPVIHRTETKGERMRITVLSICLIFTLCFEFASTPANADGWVLWVKNEALHNNDEKTTTWEINNAFPDFNKCIEAKKQVWLSKTAKYKKLEKEHNPFDDVGGTPYEFISTSLKNPKDIVGYFETFYCLPGTLDPRDRK